jgi:hypothetical protein
MARIRTLSELKSEMLKQMDRAPREDLERAIEHWIRLNKPRLSMTDIQKVKDYVDNSPTEGLIRFINENFTDGEFVSYSYKGMFEEAEYTDRQLIQYLIDAWLALEEKPENEVAKYWAEELPKELDARGVKVDKEKELRRKKREIAQGLGNINQEFIDLAIGRLKNSDDDEQRIGAARWLAQLGTESLWYYIKDQENRQNVTNALKGALTDGNSSVRHAAKVGLKLLRKR